jgi:hypothetical protein
MRTGWRRLTGSACPWRQWATKPQPVPSRDRQLRPPRRNAPRRFPSPHRRPPRRRQNAPARFVSARGRARAVTNPRHPTGIGCRAAGDCPGLGSPKITTGQGPDRWCSQPGLEPLAAGDPPGGAPSRAPGYSASSEHLMPPCSGFGLRLRRACCGRRFQLVQFARLLGGDQPDPHQVQRADEAVADAETPSAGDRIPKRYRPVVLQQDKRRR